MTKSELQGLHQLLTKTTGAFTARELSLRSPLSDRQIARYLNALVQNGAMLVTTGLHGTRIYSWETNGV